MKNNYTVLEKEYQDTIMRLSETTGWPAEQAEAVVGLVVEAAGKKAAAVTGQNIQGLKNAKYLATKKLLQNYRRLREAVHLGTEQALVLLKDTEYQRLMQAEDSVQNQRVQSVALIAAANRVLWARVNAALDCFKEICGQASRSREKRACEVIERLYVKGLECPVETVILRCHIERAEFYKCVKYATETLSVLLFGVGNTEDFIFYQGKGGCD
ncbi:hypothetical protein D5272_19480 [bacterium D16-76]|nr:hypothetical protein [bacterium D16-76]